MRTAFSFTELETLGAIVRKRNVASPILVAIAVLFSSATVSAEIELIPGVIKLSTTQARQRLVVQERTADEYLGQVTDDLEFSSSDEAVVKVIDGRAVPVGNGVATITVKSEVGQSRAEVQVVGQEKEFRWSFRNHVESVLSKAGCNSGACHGARAGQNGFRLTLFGFDLAADYSYLTRQARGRRIVPTDPGRSLLLTKPTGVVPHKGGVRIDVNEIEYRVLAEWIAEGTVGPSDDDSVIDSLEVLPRYSTHRAGDAQQLVVLAHFSDGVVEDVTRWAKYTTVDQNVAVVGDHGEVAVVGPGEGAIKVWYLNINQLAFVSVPFENNLPQDAFANEPVVNFIDELVNEKLGKLQVPPSPLCDDATFARRTFLDSSGILPTHEEVTAFLEDEAPSVEKRARLIEELLQRSEFVDYWSYKWSDLLLVNSAVLPKAAVNSYYKWIRERVENNLPWDEFVRQIVTASGSTLDNGAANFYSLHQSPEDMAETVSQAFMGLSINCAKCHNHPLEKWTNDQYYGMANMFSRVRAKGWGIGNTAGDGKRVIFSDTQGELLQPSTGRPQMPRPLDADGVPFTATGDRRIVLAQWLTSPDNPYFARSIANRIWANYMGVGLVERVDDLRVTNPASNEKLLNAIADYLTENKYDLRALMRAIMLSSTYQRSSERVDGNEADTRFYSRYYPKRLKAEVLLDALSTVTGVPTEFADHEKGTRALQLPDSNVANYFLSTFGRPDRIITCECERSDEPSMTQVLHLYNGDTLNSKLQSGENAIAAALKKMMTSKEIIQRLYLSAIGRYATEEEVTRLSEIIDAEVPEGDRRIVLEDLYWSVLTSREFLFNR
ncbi:MAG: DUF1549 and DUF1553 domain-containing protein [Pirellulaceae bacterium]